jgi:hypothetical protein
LKQVDIVTGFNDGFCAGADPVIVMRLTNLCPSGKSTRPFATDSSRNNWITEKKFVIERKQRATRRFTRVTFQKYILRTLKAALKIKPFFFDTPSGPWAINYDAMGAGVVTPMTEGFSGGGGVRYG